MRMLDSDEEYISQFAPAYKVLEEQVAQDQADVESQERMLQAFSAWRKTANELFWFNTSAILEWFECKLGLFWNRTAKSLLSWSIARSTILKAINISLPNV